MDFSIGPEAETTILSTPGPRHTCTCLTQVTQVTTKTEWFVKGDLSTY